MFISLNINSRSIQIIVSISKNNKRPFIFSYKMFYKYILCMYVPNVTMYSFKTFYIDVYRSATSVVVQNDIVLNTWSLPLILHNNCGKTSQFHKFIALKI